MSEARQESRTDVNLTCGWGFRMKTGESVARISQIQQSVFLFAFMGGDRRVGVRATRADVQCLVNGRHV